MSNSLNTIAAAAALAASCAFHLGAQAQDAEPGKSRAQVVAELDGARASGERDAYIAEDSGSFRLAQQAPATGRSRAEVMAEMFAARASGEIAAMSSEDSGAAWLAQRADPAPLTRADVMAELLKARASGELGAMYGEDSGSFRSATRQATTGSTVHAGPNVGHTGAGRDRMATAAQTR